MSNAHEHHGSAPVARGDADVLPFPLGALPVELADFVSEVANGLPAPPEFIAVPSLVVLGAAIGAARLLEVRPGWYEQSSLYAAVVADPGSRKSPAIALAARPLELRDKELSDSYNAEVEAHRAGAAMYDVNLAIWREGKRRAASGKGADPGEMPVPPEEPTFRQVSTSDSTFEALAELLSQNRRGITVVRDELTGWVRAMNQYRGGVGADRQAWLSLWSGARITINRKSRRGPLVAERPFVSVVGCLPPDVLSDLSDERGRDDGFVHRLLFSFPTPVPLRWTERTASSVALENYVDLYQRLAALQPRLDDEPIIVPFAPCGRRAFQEWANAHYAELDEVDDRLRGPWMKLEAYAARFALIIQELRFVTGDASSEEVDARSVSAAAHLVAYFKSHARRVYDHLHAHPHDREMNAVLAWMGRHNLHDVTARDVRRAKIGGIRTAEAAKRVLRELAERGDGTIAAPGRGSVVFRRFPTGDSRHTTSISDELPQIVDEGAHDKSVPSPVPETTRATKWHRTGTKADGSEFPDSSNADVDLASVDLASRPLQARARPRIQVPGDSGYLEWLGFRRGYVTTREWRERRLQHLTIARISGHPDARGETGVLADLRGMLSARARSESAEGGACRYASHRAAGDWRGLDRRGRCRICHPPASGQTWPIAS